MSFTGDGRLLACLGRHHHDDDQTSLVTGDVLLDQGAHLPLPYPSSPRLVFGAYRPIAISQFPARTLSGRSSFGGDLCLLRPPVRPLQSRTSLVANVSVLDALGSCATGLGMASFLANVPWIGWWLRHLLVIGLPDRPFLCRTSWLVCEKRGSGQRGGLSHKEL